jgi:hypothetical protein
MGLDLVEFVIEIEEKFHIRIDDRDAEHLMTPRRCINYVYNRLAKPDGACRSQKAFYYLRRALCKQTGVARTEVRPNTAVRGLLGAETPKKIWECIGTDLGAASARWWPEVRKDRWYDRWFPKWFPADVGEMAKMLVWENPADFLGINSSTQRAEIAREVHGLIAANLGISVSDPAYNEDCHFQEDMGID